MRTEPSFLGTARTLDTQSVGSVTGTIIWLVTILSSSAFIASFLGTGTLRGG